MRHFLFALPAVLLAALAFSCTPPEVIEEAKDPQIVVPGDFFEIALGDTVRIMDPDLTEFGGDLVFEEVLDDNRCPTGVQCIQAGEARISMTLYYADGTVQPFEPRIEGMHPHGMSHHDAGQSVAGAYVFHFLRLDPYPTAENGTSAQEPVAAFYIRFFER